MAYEDVARFRSDDDEALVSGAFACPWCLHDDCSVLVDEGDVLPVGSCLCAVCDARWTVHLDAGQLLRLSLDPPPSVWLRWSARVGGLRQLWDLGADDLA
ncbi:MAG: hypothetical protein HZB46_06660 [Solirubrobacterales bacterium]|nr:hypothetical protein [Solirubrobacterales bacterium]